ncbi:MAG TPA: hypothetical protein VJI12_03735 [archaeon]|nr:hypothetical protein [archaeon]
MVQRKLQILRDIVILVFCAVLGPSVYFQMNREPVFVMLFVMTAVFALLTLIDIILIAAKIKHKAYFYFNSIIQLPAFFIIAGLLGVPGIALFLLDIAVIVMLKREKIPVATVTKKAGK